MKMSIAFLAFWGMALSGFMYGAGDCEPEGNLLFSRVDLKTIKLSPKQEKILDRVRRQRTSAAIEVVKLEKSSMNNSVVPLVIPLPTNETITLSHYKIADNENAKQLTGNAVEIANSATLILTGDSVSGMVYLDKHVYSIEPLGGGLQAIIRLDQTRFPPDEPPDAQQKLERPRK
jgi:hypothetical protein